MGTREQEVLAQLNLEPLWLPFTANRQFKKAPRLLVAASPNDEVADTHWYRPDFDQFLAREAEREGIEYLDQTTIEDVRFEDGGAGLNTVREGHRRTIRARLVVDGTVVAFTR